MINGKYDYIIGYGVGQYYERIKMILREQVKFDFLCDRKWDGTKEKEYDGIPIIRIDEIAELHNAVVILVIENPRVLQVIQADLKKIGIAYAHVSSIINIKRNISGKELKESYPSGKYEDARGNEIIFGSDVSDSLIVWFQGNNNRLKIADNTWIGDLTIYYGSNGSCDIAERTEILKSEFYISGANIEIGKDCLFSTNVELRTHDHHHIFDRNTHKRINYPRNVRIGDNVWISHNVTLLGGAEIGTGSVVGAGAITSSQFGDHQIIAGVPAKVVRENICWSRDNTEFFNHDFLEECVSQDALKYL